ncbi:MULTISPECIES: TetR/AcrR family transcriptional regulator [Thermomonosporaceae]|uniref:TetR/AcrR family transcriptional regulator n=1 Tax=Thermomonosporaceae TaxID=2012 RepID=UPI00255A755A|nr:MULTISPECIES: TetR/AcrR family transcriptional regulator [Thermomonosporaceae]MDL4777358.1 TetR/AcrR family transcriptional regulator [Actinomadura xylanilytica]
MSPRKIDPRVRARLVDVAARLLAAEGPQALSARRIATEAGSSTMPVYTHFGGMSGLVREIVYEGFARMERYFALVRESDDPVADMALLGRAYRRNALANPHLYAVMFGSSTLAGFELSEEDRQHGRYTLVNVVECAGRCMAAGRFRAADEELVAHQMWTATHGLVTLELGGYLVAPYEPEACFESQLVGLMAGAGDTPEAARRSVGLSRRRMPRELAPWAEHEPAPPAGPGAGDPVGRTAAGA